MTHRLATNCAKNYCNRTIIVKDIVENVVTCFLGTRCRTLSLSFRNCKTLVQASCCLSAIAKLLVAIAFSARFIILIARLSRFYFVNCKHMVECRKKATEPG